jgi:D-aminoacyl-tRNA deacylase
MKVALVNSREDKAGQNIRHHIEQLLDTGIVTSREHGRTYEFFDVAGRLIHAEGVDKDIDADLVIFLSRHASTNPVAVLTVHVTGNFGNAELGGTPRTLAPAAPAMMQATLRALARHCPEGYRVSYEVTHHGPTGITHPSFFVEIGSTEKEWTDPAAGRAVAEAVLGATPIHAVPLIGFGGTHYAARETEITLSSRGAFGHIAHTREVAQLDGPMVRQMVEKSGAVAAYIDRKALDRHSLEQLTGILDAIPVFRLSESEIAAMGHIPWDVYCSAKEHAREISNGSRCFIHALEGEGVLTEVSIDPVLLFETVKADEPGFVKGLCGLPIIHLSTHDNRILPVFLTYENHSSLIINALNTLCVKIIRSNEITTTENDYLTIRKVRFDPAKARERGVQPGPAYKRLASGEAVEQDGLVITPDMVASVHEIKVHIPGLEKFT